MWKRTEEGFFLIHVSDRIKSAEQIRSSRGNYCLHVCLQDTVFLLSHWASSPETQFQSASPTQALIRSLLLLLLLYCVSRLWLQIVAAGVWSALKAEVEECDLNFPDSEGEAVGSQQEYRFRNHIARLCMIHTLIGYCGLFKGAVGRI